MSSMRRDEAYLLDVVLAAKRAVKYLAEIPRERFEKRRVGAGRCCPHTGNHR